MATDSIKTRVIAFDKCLLTRLNDANFVLTIYSISKTRTLMI